MHTVKRSKASWDSSSLLIGQNVVRSVGIWWLGDGKLIRAVMDPWILGPYKQLPGEYPIIEAQARNSVEEWIEPEGGRRTWGGMQYHMRRHKSSSTLP